MHCSLFCPLCLSFSQKIYDQGISHIRCDPRRRYTGQSSGGHKDGADCSVGDSTLSFTRYRLPSVIGVTVGVGMLAILLTMFDVVSALRLREEVMTINTRDNGYISPFALIAIPSYVLSLIIELLNGVRWPEVALYELLYSKYPWIGCCFTVLDCAICAGFNAAKNPRDVDICFDNLWCFFLVMPNIPATPWVGISHNLLIIPTFFISILAGFGIGVIADSLVYGKKKNPNRLFYYLLGVHRTWLPFDWSQTLGTTKTTPDELPQVTLWSDLAQHIERKDLCRVSYRSTPIIQLTYSCHYRFANCQCH